MELLNEVVLDRFARKHRDAAQWLADWAATVRESAWHSLMDVRRQYPSADGVKLKGGLVITVFNVKGNEYRLLTFISYAMQRVTVFQVLTHEQYSRGNWKGKTS